MGEKFKQPTKEETDEIAKAVLKRSGRRCECRGHCGMNHGEGRNVDGRCGLQHGRTYQMPYLDPKTAKWHRGPVTVLLELTHANHDRSDYAVANILAMCQACKLLHDTKEPWHD